MVAIKTKFCMKKRINILVIVQQGGLLVLTLCSSLIESVGRKCHERKECFYQYKGTNTILPSTYIDDIGGAAKCGEDLVRLNLFLTHQIEGK